MRGVWVRVPCEINYAFAVVASVEWAMVSGEGSAGLPPRVRNFGSNLYKDELQL